MNHEEHRTHWLHGHGKTSTGRMLAARLGAAFIDMDQRIEEETGMSIPAMFEKKGESFFAAVKTAGPTSLRTAQRRDINRRRYG